jgi:P2-related tail formation protein
VDAWDSSWTDQQKRNSILASVDIHRHKGTLAAVQSVFKLLGLSAVITEWWQTDPQGIPYTFTVTVSSTDAADAVQGNIVDSLNRVKPVRSEMLVNNTNGLGGKINLVGYACPCIFTRLEFAATIPPIPRLVTNTGAALVTNTGAFIGSP